MFDGASTFITVIAGKYLFEWSSIDVVIVIVTCVTKCFKDLGEKNSIVDATVKCVPWSVIMEAVV